MTDSPREKILLLRIDEEAPAGWVIVRLLDKYYTLSGSGANYQELCMVVVRQEARRHD